MDLIVSVPLGLRLLVLAVLGAFVGGQINRGIYRLAFFRRAIGPWSPAPPEAPPRRWFDHIPVVGWLTLQRESPPQPRGFWIRPLLIEVVVAIGFAALYAWEVEGGLLPGFLATLSRGLIEAVHAQYLAHLVLICLMIVATFIDFDEKTIPDSITIPGVAAALILSAVWPQSRMITAHPDPPAWQVLQLVSPPAAWPTELDGLAGLALALASYTAWCAALIHTTWTTRHGWRKAIVYLLVSVRRYPHLPHIAVLWIAGMAGIGAVSAIGGPSWKAALSALVGMVAGAGLIWGVRIVAGAVLQKEAMGFGDVTLMAMIGAFLGWQGALIVFFLAPFTALAIAAAQWLLTRKHEIAFGPYLCFSALLVIVGWDYFWNERAAPIFELGWFIPATVVICLLLMGLLLWGWRRLQDLFLET